MKGGSELRWLVGCYAVWGRCLMAISLACRSSLNGRCEREGARRSNYAKPNSGTLNSSGKKSGERKIESRLCVEL
jgi:hypothetical protein